MIYACFLTAQGPMDRLWALKKELDPFGRVVFGLSGPGFLLRITRCTVYQCPYCRWIFKLTWGPSNTLLGPGERKCWHCARMFWDGSDEWPEMSDQDRQLLMVPITIAGLIGAFILIGAIQVYSTFVLKLGAGFNYRAYFLIFGLALAIWFGFRGLQVMRSIRRYNGRNTDTVQ